MTGNVILGSYGFDSTSRSVAQPLGKFQLPSDGSVTIPPDTSSAALTAGVQAAIAGGTQIVVAGLPALPADLSPDNLSKLANQNNADAQAASDKKQLLDVKMSEFLNSNPFAVRLKARGNGKTVAFKVSPEINETRNNAYRTIDPVHMPGAIQVFTNSSPRSWNVSQIKLISRNGVEAEENLQLLNVLRSWMLPFFGQGSTTKQRDNYQVELRGAPPEVLSFTAYSNHGEDAKGVTNIRNIPVVMTNLNIPYSTDVDYIQTAETGQPFPSVMSIDINLIESHSAREYDEFDIIKYRYGKLPGF